VCGQVADAILANPADRTKVTLLFANVSEGDILLKDKIDAMAAAHPDRFRVHYLVDKPR
jgi:cytochrome-b5 reductase